jgi:hypothetical protein
MTRSPLAYPLNRTADMDAGGAADLQTDIMRFMAILSLCLVAIFALVQSIPLQPAEPVDVTGSVEAAAPTAAIAAPTEQEPPERTRPEQPPAATQPEPTLTLTRPKWVPKFVPERVKSTQLPVTTVAQPSTSTEIQQQPLTAPPPPAESETEGFTLRFESDAALTRLVAGNKIGLYAVGANRAQRMTVSESRVSFWDASIPNSFHEMESATVPAAVIDALARSGNSASAVSWGVTLPAQLKTKLDQLMLEHRGGTLIIVSNGDIRWEAS